MCGLHLILFYFIVSPLFVTLYIIIYIYIYIYIMQYLLISVASAERSGDPAVVRRTTLGKTLHPVRPDAYSHTLLSPANQTWPCGADLDTKLWGSAVDLGLTTDYRSESPNGHRRTSRRRGGRRGGRAGEDGPPVVQCASSAVSDHNRPPVALNGHREPNRSCFVIIQLLPKMYQALECHIM